MVSSASDYYCIDSILAEETLLPIQLACDLNPPLAQLLDSAAGARDVKELPLWLVKPLVTLGSCKTTTPKIYSKKTLAKLKASASHQLLHHLSPYYYEVGCEVSELLGDAEINSAITAAYVQRYKDILDRFGHMEDKGAGKFKGCLTLFEQRLYNLGNFMAHHTRAWRTRKLEAILPSHIANVSKRARV